MFPFCVMVAVVCKATRTTNDQTKYVAPVVHVALRGIVFIHNAV